MQAVILSFESLAANSLGCYGNEWIETPNWDRLAASGIVFDNHFANTIGPNAGWSSSPPSSRPLPTDASASLSLGKFLRTRQIATKLIVAGARQAWQEQLDFDEVQTVVGREGSDAPPDEVPIAALVKAGVAAWNDASFRQGSRLLWLHSLAPGVPPTGFESLYFEDFEERGQVISELTDDERARHPAVYAGAVSLLDHWLGELMQVVLESTDQPTLLIVTAAQGTLWHRIEQRSADSTNAWCDALTDQCIRTPLVLSVRHDPRSEDVTCTRSNHLTQCHHLESTLIDWFDQPSTTPESPANETSWLRHHQRPTTSVPPAYIASSHGDDAVRTSEWLLIRSRSGDSTSTGGDDTTTTATQRVSLFVKPEDIWDVSDVAPQHPEVIEGLLRQFPC
ncbi:sulfatase-like hydrolase/transferase [Schlesneria paludicola]|uniref:sulfatase-like hydrolase/transferase n=1 Tax=Schlesneria paludicola TaxID=360056 RepID=UPI00029B2E7B|nr:sulfatase-like hydrolase/transferase [Schlesneria paludicola]